MNTIERREECIWLFFIVPYYAICYLTDVFTQLNFLVMHLNSMFCVNGTGNYHWRVLYVFSDVSQLLEPSISLFKSMIRHHTYLIIYFSHFLNSLVWFWHWYICFGIGKLLIAFLKFFQLQIQWQFEVLLPQCQFTKILDTSAAIFTCGSNIYMHMLVCWF